MDTDSFVMNIKTDDFYKDSSNDVDKWFDTSNYDKNDNRPLEIGKNKKVIGKFKDELGGKIMTEFCALRAKAYAYKLDDDTEMKKAKGTKKCIVKTEITFKNYVDALFKDKVLIKSQERFRSDHHKVCTEEINKIALSSNDDKCIQTFDKVTTYPYGTNTFIVCENETRYILLRKNMLNNDSEAFRDKSLLRNEAQALRTNSLLLRNELKELRAKYHDIKTESCKLRTESLLLRNESKESESQMIKADSQILRAKSLKSQIDIIIANSQKLRKKSENTRKKSDQIIANSQKLRKELELKSMQPSKVKNCYLSFDGGIEETYDNTIKETIDNTIKETIDDTIKETIDNTKETIDNTIEGTIDNTIEETIDNTIEETIDNTIE